MQSARSALTLTVRLIDTFHFVEAIEEVQERVAYKLDHGAFKHVMRHCLDKHILRTAFP